MHVHVSETWIGLAFAITSFSWEVGFFSRVRVNLVTINPVWQIAALGIAGTNVYIERSPPIPPIHFLILIHLLHHSVNVMKSVPSLK